MQHAAGGALPRTAHLAHRAVVRPTRYRAASEPWIAWTMLTVAALVAGVATGLALFLLVGLVLAVLTVRSGWRLVRSLGRLDDVGLSRWQANVAMMLLPPEQSHRRHGITHVPVPEGVDRTPEAVLRHVLADDQRRPTVAPWVACDDEPRTGGRGPARPLWLAVGAGVVGWFAAVAFVAAVDDASTTVRVASASVAAVPVIVASVLVARYRIALHHDGRLEIRRGTHLRVLRLDQLLQVSGWTWSLDTRRSPDEQRRLHGATLSLVFGDGSHAVLRPAHVRHDEVVGHALRWWVRYTSAVVTPDAAYALGFTDDPREPGGARTAADDRWMRRPLRRVRTAAVHLLLATTILHPLVLGAGVLALLG